MKTQGLTSKKVRDAIKFVVKEREMRRGMFKDNVGKRIEKVRGMNVVLDALRLAEDVMSGKGPRRSTERHPQHIGLGSSRRQSPYSNSSVSRGTDGRGDERYGPGWFIGQGIRRS